MALEVVGGAVLGAAVAELLKAVKDAKEKDTNFQQVLTRLESTLRSVTPRVKQILKLNKKLNIRNDEMKELVTILQNGKALVDKCSQISSINLIRKGQYSNQLLELDYSLLRYCQTILVLDNVIDTKEILLMTSGESSNQIQTVTMIPEIEEMKDSQGMDTWKFRLKGCTYNFDLRDLIAEYTEPRWGSDTYTEKRIYNVADCDCNIKHGQVMVMRYQKEMDKSEFEDQMEILGDLRNHPNILPPIGYCFHECDTLLFYDNFPRGSLYSRLHEYRGRRRLSYEYPVKCPEFKWDYKLKICLGVARGIAHLHSVKFIHGNLNSYNVLLNSDFDACISSYGLQYFSSDIQKSDVHSFGLLLIEIISEIIPTEGKEHTRSSSWGDYCAIATKNNRLPSPYKWDMHKILSIALQCVDENPNKRPEMDDVVKRLQAIRTSY